MHSGGFDARYAAFTQARRRGAQEHRGSAGRDGGAGQAPAARLRLRRRAQPDVQGGQMPAPLTAVEASRALAAGKLTSQALVEACIDRIEQVDGKLNSFVLVLAEAARKAARAADRARKAGKK